MNEQQKSCSSVLERILAGLLLVVGIRDDSRYSGLSGFCLSLLQQTNAAPPPLAIASFAAH